MALRKMRLMAVAIFLFSTSFCQDKKGGTISGFVKDAQTKLPLVEAVVTLKSDAFEGQKITVTDSAGNYKIVDLPEGNYTIIFEMEGYQKYVQENVAIKAGAAMGISFQMAKAQKMKSKSFKYKRDSSEAESKPTNI